MNYRDVIRAAMKAQGINQRQLAALLNVTEARIGQLLGPKGNPTAKTLARVAAVLGLTVRFRFLEKSVPEQIRVWSLAA